MIRRTAMLLLAALASCAPITSVAVHSSPAASAPPVEPARASVDPAAGNAALRAALPRVGGLSCTIAFQDAPVILARVGDAVITACDLAVAAELDAREGGATRSPRERLRQLVDETLLAQEASTRGLDRDPTVSRRLRDSLAAAFVRNEAMASVRNLQPDDADVARYYAAHQSDFTTSERAHLRHAVLEDEAAARAVIRDAATTAFEVLVRERSVGPEAARDEGDLGLVARDGNDRVAQSIAQAGFAIAEPGAVHPEPIRVETTVLEGRRRRPRTHVTWHVVQLLERIPSVTTSLADAARIIRFRLAYGRYEAARIAAEQRLSAEARSGRPVQVRAAGLRRVHVIAGPPAPPPRRLGRVR